jgi:hypothetical protein
VDGVGFEDLELAVDEARKTVVLRFTKGDRVKSVDLPLPLDCGPYDEAIAYRRGNVVTRGGSMWVALLDASKGVKPGESTEESRRAWRCCVMRGKEGKGGPRGPQGAPGQDLRWENHNG